ncbi:TPA: oligosaccharide repeat unit polymerase [Vibrio parahaemolyticus]|nr:oligosaccharide repeat unit polymerase [Vibrio parahaemolyticus]
MPESILYLLYSLVCLSLAYRFDRSDGKMLFFFSSPFVIFLSLFPLHFELGLGQASGWMELNSFELSYRSWFWLIIIISSYTLAFFICLVLNFNLNRASSFKSDIYNLKSVRKWFYILGLLSLFACLINFSRVNFSLSLLFVSPRQYEETFGMYWFINYMYFLHIPSLILFSIIAYEGRLKKIDVIFSILVFFGAFFHGIKYTVFDAIFFPLIYYIGLVGFSKLRKQFFKAIFFFLIFFILFSAYVRGSNDAVDFLSFLNYLIPNYYNLFYAIELNPFPLSLPLDSFMLFASAHFSDSLGAERLVGGFVLNDKYNMMTGSGNLIESLGIFGFVFYYLFINTVVLKIQGRYVFSVFIKSYLLFSYLMFFYSYYIGSKPKYIYLLLVMLCLDIVLRKSSKVNKC